MDYSPHFISTAPEIDIINVQLTLAYDGLDFLGWQETHDGPTIEGTLRRVLKRITLEDLPLQAASRTDAGVHAEGQIIHFFIRKKYNLATLQKGLNALLPTTIRVLKIQSVPLDFTTMHYQGKEYHYHIYNEKILPPKERNYSWHVYKPLCLSLMQQAAPFFLGKKDFSAFCNVKNGHEKVDKYAHLFDLSIHTDFPGKIRIRVCGDRFLYKMVRNIVGTLVAVGKGEIALEDIDVLFAKKDRTLAAMTAPAHGLTLKKVFHSHYGEHYEWKK